MSAEKHQWLIDNGLLNPDGSRPPHVVPEPPADGDATGEAEAVVADVPEEAPQ